MSDVFGQFVDLSNNDGQDTDPAARWLIGEDLPFSNATRDMANPNASKVGAQPAKTSDPQWDSDWSDAGGVHTNSGVGNKAAELITDGTAGEPGGTFNGKTVLPLGLDKAAAIYYRAEQTLTSGSDYRDLYNILRGSCTALVGTTPNNAAGTPSPDGAITTANCDQVTAAVTAVQMNVYPAKDPKIPTAPAYCGTGYTVSNLLSDPFETPFATNWTGSSAWTRSNIYQPTAGSGFAAYVKDYTDTGTSTIPPTPMDRRLVTRNTYTMPSGRSSYLRFDHADAFDWYGAPIAVPSRYWDGGFVEVSVDGKAFKPLNITVNGYNHNIEATRTAQSVRKGFGGDSTDWYTSRATMSSFAGHQVRVRFRMLTDGFVSLSQSYGWWLDNVRLYSCRGPSAPHSVKVANMRGAKAKITWQASTPNPGFTIASYVVKISGRPAVTLSASARRRVFRHLTIGHTYTFRIRAKNNLGASSVTVTRRLRIT
jgi:hypothetical protein